jgi:hypothetical protein
MPTFDSMKSLTNCENPPVTLFRELVVALRKPHITLKIVPEAACDTGKSTLIFPASNEGWTL